MRYWVFQNGRLSGPHGPDELMRLSGFSAGSLICREDARAGEAASWRRACLTPELSVVLACRSAAAQEEPGPATEPVVDAEIAGHIERRIAALAEAVSRLHESFEAEAARTLELARLSAEESRQFRALGAQLGGCEQRASTIPNARVRLEGLFSAARQVEKYLGVRERNLAELTGKLEALREETGDRKAGCSELEKLNAGLREDMAELKRRIESLKAPEPRRREEDAAPRKPPLPPARRKPPLPPTRRKPPLPPAMNPP